MPNCWLWAPRGQIAKDDSRSVLARQGVPAWKDDSGSAGDAISTDHGLEQNVRNSVPVSIFQNHARKHEEVRLWIYRRQLILKHVCKQAHPVSRGHIAYHLLPF